MIMMLSRPRVLGGVAGLILVLALSSLVVEADTGGPWRAAGQAIRGHLDKSDVVARVDSASVTRRDVLSVQADLTLNNALSPSKVSTTAREALQRIVRFVALSEEAYRRGFKPSAAEVNDYIASMRAASKRSAQGEAELGQFLTGLGMTADQYFARAEVWESESRAMAVARLREEVLRNVNYENQNAVWDAFEKSVLGRASITITDPALR